MAAVRNALTGVVISGVFFGLVTGCTAEQTPPVTASTPPGQSGAPASPSGVWLTPTPIPWATGEFDLATIDIIEDDLICEPPAAWAVDWVTVHITRFQGSSTQLPATDFSMVKVGEGNTPGSVWWIVAVVSYSDAFGGMQRRDMSFLTDSSMWINVGWQGNSIPTAVRWADVQWSGQQLYRGLEAQKKALSCLP